MNYIAMIRRFWRSHEENSFTATEIALYFHLLEICNICQWKNPFRRRNDKIQADLGISYNTLKNARNKLKQYGLIGFESQSGNANVIYRLSEFDEQMTEGWYEESNEVVPAINNNKNKTETKPNKDKPKTAADRFVPPQEEEVTDYFIEKGLACDEAADRAERFCNFYNSKNWMVGRNRMTGWKPAAANSLRWENSKQITDDYKRRTEQSRRRDEESVSRKTELMQRAARAAAACDNRHAG